MQKALKELSTLHFLPTIQETFLSFKLFIIIINCRSAAYHRSAQMCRYYWEVAHSQTGIADWARCSWNGCWDPALWNSSWWLSGWEPGSYFVTSCISTLPFVCPVAYWHSPLCVQLRINTPLCMCAVTDPQSWWAVHDTEWRCRCGGGVAHAWLHTALHLPPVWQQHPLPGPHTRPQVSSCKLSFTWATLVRNRFRKPAKWTEFREASKVEQL